MKLPKVIVWGLALLTVAALAACTSPSSSSGSSTSTGGGSSTPSLVLSIGDQFSRTMVPTLSMTAASYSISGTGPGGVTFTQSTTGTSLTVNSLAVGSWAITVNAYNGDATPTLIGTGSTSATVTAGNTTNASVSVTPLTGTGNLALTINWPSSAVTTPSIQASLAPAISSIATNAWTYDSGAGSASYTASALATGYSTLVLSLLDGTLVKGNYVDVVRILKDQTTTGSFSFTNLNSAGGNITVAISNNSQSPLTVTVTGSVTGSIAANSTATAASQTFTVSATGNTGTGTIGYVWYKDGVNVGTGTTYAYTKGIPSGYSAPYYANIAVVAITSDGTQAGVVNFYQQN